LSYTRTIKNGTANVKATATFTNEAILWNYTKKTEIASDEIKHQISKEYDYKFTKNGGKVVVDENGVSIDWTIKLTNGNSAITDVALYDSFGTDRYTTDEKDKWKMVLDADSVKVISSGSAKGTVHTQPGTDATSDKTYDWYVSFPTVAAGEEITISYTTTIANPDTVLNGNLWGDWGSPIENTAWVTFKLPYGEGGSGESVPFIGPEVKKQASWKKMFEKCNGTVPYDQVTRIFTWRFIVNENYQSIKDAKIKEILPAGHEYVDTGAITATYQPSADAKSQDLTVTVSDQTFSMGDITGKVVFDIQTRLTDEEYKVLLSTTPSKDGTYAKKYTNHAELYSGTTYLTKDYQDTTATNTMITKKLYKDYDYNTHTMEWQIDVNQSKMLLAGMVVTDELDENLELVSVKADNGTGSYVEIPLGNISMEETTPGRTTIKIPLMDVTEEQEGKDAAKRSIIICTKVKNTSKLLLTNGTVSVKNRAALYTSTFDTTVLSNEAECKFSNVALRKTGAIAEGTKVDYTIYVNEAQGILPVDAVITDIMGSGLTLDPNSMELHYTTVVNGKCVDLGDTVPTGSYAVQHTVDAATGETTITLSLPKGNNNTFAYAFTYSATAKKEMSDVKGAYDNKVTSEGYILQDNSYTVVSFDASTFGFGFLGGYKYVKLTKQETGNADILLKGAVFTLYQQDADGTWINRGNRTTDASGTIYFIFKGNNTNKYKVVETQAPAGYTLNEGSNEYELKMPSNVGKSNAYQIVVENKKESILFTKVDKNGNPLRGASFALYQVDGEGNETQINTMTSLRDGVIHFTADPGKYHIRELTAPAGYLLSNVVLEVVIAEDGIVNGPYVYSADSNTQTTSEVVTAVINYRIPGGGGGSEEGGGGGGTTTYTSSGGGGTTTTTTTTTTTPTGQVLGASRTPGVITIPEEATPLAPGVLGTDRLPKTGGFWGTGIIYILGAIFIFTGVVLFFYDKKKMQALVAKIKMHK